MTFREILERQEQLQKTAEQASQIEELKRQLASSNNKIIECYEYSLVSLDAPYDIAQIHGERQAIRDRINALEAEIAAIGNGKV